MNKLKAIVTGIALAAVGILLVSTGEGFLIAFGIVLFIFAFFAIYGGITISEQELKKEVQREEKKKIESKWKYENNYFYFNDKKLHVSDVRFVSVEVALLKWETSYLNISCENGNKYRLPVPPKRLDEAIKLQTIFALDKVSCKNSNKEYDPKKAAEDRNKMVDFLTTDPALNPKKKEASVVGRAIVGGIIAGEVGATVGALSAIDENNKNKE